MHLHCNYTPLIMRCNKWVLVIKVMVVTVYTGAPGTRKRGTSFRNTLFATQNRDRGRQEHTLMTFRLDTEAGKHRACKGTNE